MDATCSWCGCFAERVLPMTLAKHDLIVRYLNGGTEGNASREAIEVLETPDGTEYRCIIGYGWAVYAAEIGVGQYALFGDGYASHNTDVGWAGYSGQTTQHLQELKGMFEQHDIDYVVVDRALKSSDVESGMMPPTAAAELHKTKPAPGEGYTRTL